MGEMKEGIINPTYTIRTTDEIVLRVLKKMDDRSLIGQTKYGATMMGEIENEVKDLDRFLVDVQEELMDSLLYIEAARELIKVRLSNTDEG